MSANWLTARSNEWSGVRQLFRETGLPLDAGSSPSGDGEHAVVRIDSGHVSVCADANMRGTRQDARAASDVEHAVLRSDIGNIEHDIGPLLEQGGHEEGVVDLGGAG
jgi:hypothetical protein